MISGLINPLKEIKSNIEMKSSFINTVHTLSASCTLSILYACGVIPTGFFIARLCSMFYPLSTPYLIEKTGTSLRYINYPVSVCNVWTLDNMRRNPIYSLGKLMNGVTDSVA